MGKLILANLAVLNAEREDVHSCIHLVAERESIPLMRIAAVRVSELVWADAKINRLAALIPEGDGEPSELGEDGFKDFLAQGLACTDDHLVIFGEVAQAEYGSFGGKKEIPEDEVLGESYSGQVFVLAELRLVILDGLGK